MLGRGWEDDSGRRAGEGVRSDRHRMMDDDGRGAGLGRGGWRDRGGRRGGAGWDGTTGGGRRARSGQAEGGGVGGGDSPRRTGAEDGSWGMPGGWGGGGWIERGGGSNEGLLQGCRPGWASTRTGGGVGWATTGGESVRLGGSHRRRMQLASGSLEALVVGDGWGWGSRDGEGSAGAKVRGQRSGGPGWVARRPGDQSVVGFGRSTRAGWDGAMDALNGQARGSLRQSRRGWAWGWCRGAWWCTGDDGLGGRKALVGRRADDGDQRVGEAVDRRLGQAESEVDG